MIHVPGYLYPMRYASFQSGCQRANGRQHGSIPTHGPVHVQGLDERVRNLQLDAPVSSPDDRHAGEVSDDPVGAGVDYLLDGVAGDDGEHFAVCGLSCADPRGAVF